MKLALLLLILSSLALGDDAGTGRPSGGGLLMCGLFLVLWTMSTAPALAVGARPLAMGSAYIGVSDDENAIFFNVAGLSQLDKDLNQVAAQVEDPSNLARTSITHVGKIYQEADSKKLTLEEYLESDYNFKAEVQRVSNYAYGTAYSTEHRSLKLNQDSGFVPASADNVNTTYLGFATRFPIAERLTRRPELYGGARLRFTDVHRSIPTLGTRAEQQVGSMDVHMFYRANSRFNIGAVVDNVISFTNHENTGARPFATILSVGGAYYYGEKRDTIIAVDFTNVTNSETGVQDPAYHVGAERQFLDNDFVVRIGSNDGNLTLGVGVRFWEDFRLDYAFESGTVINPNTVSLRLVF